MQQTTSHIKNTKYFFWIWFILFALSPCIVKEALFSSVDITYTKPLNKSKSTTPANACQYFQNDKQQISVARQLKISKGIEPAVGNPYFVAHPALIYGKYAKNLSGNSPPKYILYKCLKLDVVRLEFPVLQQFLHFV